MNYFEAPTMEKGKTRSINPSLRLTNNRIIEPGLNFQAVCHNMECMYPLEFYISPMGYSKIPIAKICCTIKCPSCGSRKKRGISAIYIYGCQLEWRGMTKAVDEASKDKAITYEELEQLQSHGSMAANRPDVVVKFRGNQQEICQWKWLTVNAKKLPEKDMKNFPSQKQLQSMNRKQYEVNLKKVFSEKALKTLNYGF